MYGVVPLLDVRHQPAFKCPICRHIPDSKKVVNMDGLAQGFKASTMEPAAHAPADCERVIKNL